MDQRIYAIAGVERGPRKTEVGRFTARNGSGGTVVRGGKCIVERKESKHGVVCQGKVIVYPRRTVERHSVARTWGPKKSKRQIKLDYAKTCVAFTSYTDGQTCGQVEIEIYSDVESDAQTNSSFGTVLTSVSVFITPRQCKLVPLKTPVNRWKPMSLKMTAIVLLPQLLKRVLRK